MAMSTGTEAGAPMCDINTTPLIDVMLVLLVTLIVTLPIMTHALEHLTHDVDGNALVVLRDLAALETDAHQPVLGIPRTAGDFDVGRERVFAARLRIIVFEIIDHLLDAHGVGRRHPAFVQEPADVRVGRRVNVNGKRGERMIQRGEKRILD